jgi:hypothetical protein
VSVIALALGLKDFRNRRGRGWACLFRKYRDLGRRLAADGVVRVVDAFKEKAAGRMGRTWPVRVMPEQG